MKLIVNGDDFGITRACNYAIIDCYKYGFLTSTSMMTNMPGFPHAVELMKEYPDLSVGIHLNLTVGKPLIKDLKTLVNAEGKLNKDAMNKDAVVDPEEIRKEITAQFDYFVELTGQLPTHINSHHGIEMIPGAEAIQLELAKKHQLPVRRFFTLPKGNHPDSDFVIPNMCLIMKEDWSIPIEPEDIINFFSDDMLKSDDIYELAAHPGYVDYELMQLSSLTNARCNDAYNFMCDELKDWIKTNNIELVTYSQIPLKG